MFNMKKMLIIALLLFLTILSFAIVSNAEESIDDILITSSVSSKNINIGDICTYSLRWGKKDIQAVDIDIKYEEAFFEKVATYVIYQGNNEREQIDNEFTNKGTISWFSKNNKSIVGIDMEFIAKKNGSSQFYFLTNMYDGDNGSFADKNGIVFKGISSNECDYTHSVTITGTEYSVEKWLLSQGNTYDLNEDEELSDYELSQIETINFTNNDMVTLDTSIVSRIPNLNMLKIVGNNLKVIDFRTIGQASNLKELIISADLQTLDLNSIYEISDNLTRFSLTCNIPEIINSIDFSKFQNVVDLALACRKLEDFDFNKLSSMSDLKKLDYGFGGLNDYGPLGKLEKLEYVEGIDMKDIKALNYLEDYFGLKYGMVKVKESEEGKSYYSMLTLNGIEGQTVLGFVDVFNNEKDMKDLNLSLKVYNYTGKHNSELWVDNKRVDTSKLAEKIGAKLIATGDMIFLCEGNGEYVRGNNVWAAVVKGDVNGDGEINATDALAIIKNATGKIKFDDNIFSEAGKIVSDTEQPTALDALAVVKHKLGKYTIDQNVKIRPVD